MFVRSKGSCLSCVDIEAIDVRSPFPLVSNATTPIFEQRRIFREGRGEDGFILHDGSKTRDGNLRQVDPHQMPVLLLR